MKAQKIEIAVEATITDESAQRCLRLLEMYLNDHLNITINHYYQKTDAGIVHMLELVPDGGNGENAERWIPVEDGLPEEDGRYLVTRYDDVTNTEFIDILWYEENLWWNRHSTGDYAVTAWMPLPTPYKRR